MIFTVPGTIIAYHTAFRIYIRYELRLDIPVKCANLFYHPMINYQ